MIGGRYRPIRVLGRGGGGTVYEAEHLHTGARVALKLFTGFAGASSDAVTRFQREARVAAALDSEHVVRITDAGTAPELSGMPFLVMELMQGRTLEQEARAPLPPPRVVLLLGQVARALERAHSHGITHRDLKPDNLFLTQRDDGTPCVKVLDFGIAKRGQTESSTLQTEQGMVLGTPMYMSPEQASGQVDLIDARADTWALGQIAFRLLFGVAYFPEDATLRMLNRVAYEPIKAPSQLGYVASAAFDEWFLRSCSRDLDKRYASALAQMDDLAAALEGVAEVEVRAATISVRKPSGKPPEARAAAPEQASSPTELAPPVAAVQTPAGSSQSAALPNPNAARPGFSKRRLWAAAAVAVAGVVWALVFRHAAPVAHAPLHGAKGSATGGGAHAGSAGPVPALERQETAGTEATSAAAAPASAAPQAPESPSAVPTSAQPLAAPPHAGAARKPRRRVAPLDPLQDQR